MTLPDAVTVEVGLGDRAYDILIGPGLLGRAGAEIARRLPGVRAAIVTAENLAPPHLATLARGPEITVCRGALRLASRRSGSANSTCRASGPASTAAIVPGSADAISRIKRPRASESWNSTSSEMLPPAHSAMNSP